MIHNLSGCSLYYAPADMEHASRLFQKKHLFTLPHGRSEKLRVDPSQRACELQAADGTVITSYRTGVISLQFHGLWMPIQRESGPPPRGGRRRPSIQTTSGTHAHAAHCRSGDVARD